MRTFAKRGELIKKAAGMIQEDVATIRIFNNIDVYTMKKNIHFKPTQKRPLSRYSMGPKSGVKRLRKTVSTAFARLRIPPIISVLRIISRISNKCKERCCRFI
jgi:tRNA U34 5-carboxymethylaminomethyl modifying GTPase MnmE/TrmE